MIHCISTRFSQIHPILKYFIIVILLAVIYHLVARLGLMMAYVQANTSPVWPPTGIGLVALLLLMYYPAQNVTRAEIAVFLVRTFELP